MRTHLFGQITAINCCQVVLKSLTDSRLTNCNSAGEFLKSCHDRPQQSSHLCATSTGWLVLQVPLACLQLCSFNSNVLNVSQACVCVCARRSDDRLADATILISCNKWTDISLAPSTHLFDITYILIWKYQQSQHTSVVIQRLHSIRGWEHINVIFGRQWSPLYRTHARTCRRRIYPHAVLGKMW